RNLQSRLFLGLAFWTSAVGAFLTLIGYQQFQAFTSGLQFEERLPWLPSIGVSYHLGVDGIGMSLLLLNSVIGISAVLASWDVRERAREYFALLLLAQAAVNGVVVARDLFVLTLFWTAASVPLAFLVAGWGSARRGTAAGRLRPDPPARRHRARRGPQAGAVHRSAGGADHHLRRAGRSELDRPAPRGRLPVARAGRRDGAGCGRAQPPGHRRRRDVALCR